MGKEEATTEVANGTVFPTKPDNGVCENKDVEKMCEKKKRKKKKDSEEEKEEPKTPVARTIDRPVRERKSVERLVAIIEENTVKEFRIKKGRGTALKDIPNVAYKLSKKKVSDDVLKLLHTVLYGRRGKALGVKSNILRFSGFVWGENEEKEKAKVQEKLDKCNKDKLFELCDLLDIPIPKPTAKKEDVVMKLLDFLLLPHITEQQSSEGSKRKRTSKKSWASPSKKQKAEEGEGNSETEEEEERNEVHMSESESREDSSKKHKRGSKKSSSKNESSALKKSTESRSKSEDPTPKTVSRKNNSQPLSPKKFASKEKTGKKGVKDEKQKPSDDQLKAAIREILEHEVNFSTATFRNILKLLAKRFNTDVSTRKATIKSMIRDELIRLADDLTDDDIVDLSPKKSASKEKTGKNVMKEEKQEPSDDELKAATCEILRQVDFNAATFTDILKLLGKRFNMDLTSRKGTIKLITQDELTRLYHDSFGSLFKLEKNN